MSLFITFEGGEGSGKSTQAILLKARLSKAGIKVLLTHEPGGTPFGRRMSRLLKWGHQENMFAVTELFLFNASRAQLVGEVIQPELVAGHAVVCDRFTDSTLAYQSYGRGLDADLVKAVNDGATGGLKPDLTILMDLPVERGFQRKEGKKPDRFEQEGNAFHRKVRDGYLKMAAAEPGRWLIVDGAMSKAKIAALIWQRVESMLPRKRRG